LISAGLISTGFGSEGFVSGAFVSEGFVFARFVVVIEHQAQGQAHVHQHPVAHPGLGQAGQAHLLAHAAEIHLGLAPEGVIGIVSGSGRLGNIHLGGIRLGLGLGLGGLGGGGLGRQARNRNDASGHS
jgi:hypothetical protein